MTDNAPAENQLTEREQAENQQILTTRYDRNSLRADVNHQELRSAEMSAFLLGRLCNELRFSMQLGWIEMRHCVRNPDDLFHHIEILSRELCQNLESKQEQEASLAACRERWSSAFGSEGARSHQLVDLFDKLDDTSNLQSEDTELFRLFDQQVSAIQRFDGASPPLSLK